VRWKQIKPTFIVKKWECDESIIAQTKDVSILVQPKGANYPGSREAQVLKIEWTCKGVAKGKISLHYMVEDFYKIDTPRDFSIENFRSLIYHSFENIKQEFHSRIDHLGNFELHFSLPNSQIQEFYETLEYGK